MQACAQDTPMPVRHELQERKDKPTTTNVQQCRAQPTHSNTFIQTADRVSVKRQQPGRSPSLQAAVSMLSKLEQEKGLSIFWSMKKAVF